MSLHNTVFVKYPEGWRKVPNVFSTDDDKPLDRIKLQWYEWPYLWFLIIRDFITRHK